MDRIFKLLLFIVAGVSIIFAVPAIYAGTSVQDVIQMNNKAYSKHSKGIVQFSHKKHTEEYIKAYGKLYSSACGDCHHDAKNTPLNSLKKGDNVQNCIECHKIPGRKPRAKKGAPSLTKQQRLAYHAEALHYNCKDCHKIFNKDYKPKKAPTTCGKCHPKK
jgi:nitrate/TMAO reductase-like tetraheme cytochrome c subunit